MFYLQRNFNAEETGQRQGGILLQGLVGDRRPWWIDVQTDRQTTCNSIVRIVRAMHSIVSSVWQNDIKLALQGWKRCLWQPDTKPRGIWLRAWLGSYFNDRFPALYTSV